MRVDVINLQTFSSKLRQFIYPRLWARSSNKCYPETNCAPNKVDGGKNLIKVKIRVETPHAWATANTWWTPPGMLGGGEECRVCVCVCVCMCVCGGVWRRVEVV